MSEKLEEKKENEKQGITIQEYQEIKNKEISELEEMVSGAQSKGLGTSGL